MYSKNEVGGGEEGEGEGKERRERERGERGRERGGGIEFGYLLFQGMVY